MVHLRGRAAALQWSGALLLFLIMRFQGSLPLNPQDYPNVESRLAFNTAVSFVTNTNWQSYGGEADDEQLHPDGRGWPCRTSCRPPPAWRSRLR